MSKDLRRKKENMRSIVMTYPGFQTLPRGLKMLLVASESFFFREAKSPLLKPRSGELTVRVTLKPNKRADLNKQFLAFSTAWRN